MTPTDIPWNPIFGRITVESLAFLKVYFHPSLNNFIASGAAMAVLVGGVIALAGLTYFKVWKTLWNDWFTTVDHKKIGVMYIVLAMIMLLRGVVEGVVMRAQQADGLHGGFLSAEHYGELFSTHGTIMIFFMAMPFLTGLINIVVPLQIGARDVSFPMLNSVSLGLTISGAVLIMVSLVVGEFSTGGWTNYPPFTEAAFQPGVGPDYWIWSVSLAGIGTTLTGLNFVVTIYKERAPGMTWMKMPMFTWAAFCTAILMVFAMPPLTVAGVLLALDRYLDFHFFTNALGGNMMNYANLVWLFGHPEVYILILPAFGVYSEIFATYSQKRLYGYGSLVAATMCIAVLSFTVWLHHFFTMGQSASVNAAFGIATMLIGIPTGVKIYDWMATIYRGRLIISVPIVYGLAFLMLFAIGGLTGIILANPAIDYQVHNTLFLVAHFHNMLIPGLLFGMLAGYTYWFPKVFGFKLNDFWGYVAAGCWILGFMFAFFPLYAVGLMGMTRRTVAYSDPGYMPWFLIAMIGGLFVLAALGALMMQLFVSIRDRHLQEPQDDPWNARSLEWATPSPVPAYNFAIVPTIDHRDAYSKAKEMEVAYLPVEKFNDIHLPGKTALGVILAVFGSSLGFGLTWHIWWMVIGSLLVILVSFLGRVFTEDHGEHISAATIRRDYDAWIARGQKRLADRKAAETELDKPGINAPKPMEPAE